MPEVEVVGDTEPTAGAGDGAERRSLLADLEREEFDVGVMTGVWIELLLLLGLPVPDRTTFPLPDGVCKRPASSGKP